MTRETEMRGAARQRSYSYAQHGKSNRAGAMGNHFLRRGAGVEIWKPSWNGTLTTFRIYPAVCPENPAEFDPWRFTGDDDDWGDWIRTYPCVRNFGDPGVSFILYDPRDDGYDAQLNPAHMLFNAIDRAVGAGEGEPHWAPFLRGGQNRGAALKRPGDVSFVQGAMTMHKNKAYDPPRGGALNDGSLVLELGPSPTSAMLDLFNERVPEFRGDPNDFNSMFVSGDPVSLEFGKFVNFYQLGFDPRERQQANPTARRASFGQERRESRSGGGGKGATENGYGCYLTDTALDGTPANLDGVEDMVRRKWKPWDEIIQIHTHEDQIRLLSGAFPPDMIIYAFEGMYRDYIPDTVWNASVNKVQSGPDGSPPRGGAPSHPPQGSTGGAPATRRGFGGTSSQPPVQVEEDPNHSLTPEQPPVQTPAPTPAPARTGGRRGFGGTSTSTEVPAEAETVPAQDLPQGAPQGGYDPQPPQAGAPAQDRSASVKDAIRRSKEAMAKRK